jgi:protein TonB
MRNSAALRRLAAAVAVSAALHAWLAIGVPVGVPRPEGRTEGVTLRARLTTVAPVPEDQPAPAGGPRDAPQAVPPGPAAPEPAPAEAADVPPVEPERAPLSEAPVAAAIDAPPAVEIPQVEDPQYYPVRMLDALPAPLAEVDLVYPESAGDGELSGTVTLLLLIDELGLVNDASVLEADPPGYFEEAAIAAFRDVLFRPGQRNGRAVKSRLVVEVSFQARAESMKSP